MGFFVGILFLKPKINLGSILHILIILYLILLKLGSKNWRYWLSKLLKKRIIKI
jgi:hypothetical protein